MIGAPDVISRNDDLEAEGLTVGHLKPAGQSKAPKTAPGGGALKALLRLSEESIVYTVSRRRLIAPKGVGEDKACRVSLLAVGDKKSGEVPELISRLGAKKAGSRVAQATRQKRLRVDGIGWEPRSPR